MYWALLVSAGLVPASALALHARRRTSPLRMPDEEEDAWLLDQMRQLREEGVQWWLSQESREWREEGEAAEAFCVTWATFVRVTFESLHPVARRPVLCKMGMDEGQVTDAAASRLRVCCDACVADADAAGGPSDCPVRIELVRFLEATTREAFATACRPTRLGEGRRWSPAVVQRHASDRQHGGVPQLQSLAAHLNQDILVIQRDPAVEGALCVRCTGRVLGMVVWDAEIAQDCVVITHEERDGVSHYGAAVRRR